MKNHVGIVIAVGSLFLSGCIGQLAPSQRIDSAGINVILAAAKLPEVDAEKAKKMTSLGPVTGYIHVKTSLLIRSPQKKELLTRPRFLQL